MNLGWFGIDQLEEVPEEMWLGLVGRLRRNGVRHTAFGVGNPEGHNWVWKRWVMQPDQDHFIVVSESSDNIHLPAGYVDSLIKNYPEEWVKRYVMGSFDTYEGLVYKDFSDKEPFVVERLPERSEHWYRFVGIDHGYRNPTCVLWAAVAPTGEVYVYDEFYASGKLVSQIAEIIHTKDKDIKSRLVLIDPSCRNKNGQTGRSVIDEFMDYGIACQPANNDVRAGINHVQEMLKLQGGKPQLRILKQCVNLRTELQTYRWKDLKPGHTQNGPEKPVKKDDHACLDATTMIYTKRGNVPISEITKWDSVLTREGFKPVLSFGITGYRDVFEYVFSDGRKLVATSDHPVFANGKYTPLGLLTDCDTLCILEQKGDSICISTEKPNLSSSTESRSDVIPTAPIYQNEDTFVLAEIISTAGLNTYTAKSGNPSMGKSQPDATYTTGTETHSTTMFPILNLSMNGRISDNIQDSTTGNTKQPSENTLNGSDPLQSHGTSQRKDINGTGNTPTKSPRTSSRLRRFVNSVARYIRQRLGGVERDSVPATASNAQEPHPALTTKQEPVSSVESRLLSTDTQEIGHVPDRAVRLLGVKPLGKRLVWNLTVEDAHEYFANGILTHNCDCARYLLNYVYDTPNLKKKRSGFDYKAVLARFRGETTQKWMAA
jgi:hypothetical protein